MAGRPKDVAASLDRLYRRSERVIKLGLDAMAHLAEELENPQDAFLSFHIAGTNGKGSVCAMLAAILQEAGFKTGLYTSPHLVRFNERIRVNGRPVSDADLAVLLDDVESAANAAKRRPGGRDVTFFEFATGVAFEHFRRQGVHVAVVEVGMGGRLDATNIVTPAVTAITSIGFDHMEYLGDTIPKIASEKAGIIKRDCPVIVGDLDPEAMDVMVRTARERGAPLVKAGEAVTVWRKNQSLGGQRLKVETEDEHYGPLQFPLIGDHQLGNVAVAVGVVEAARRRLGLALSKQVVEKGLERVSWPGRFQVLGMEPPMVLDGAHNPHAAAALRKTLQEVGPGYKLGLIAGFLGDKDAGGFLREFAGRCDALWLVPLDNKRAMPMAGMMAAARQAGIEAKPSTIDQALAEATAWGQSVKGLVCIAGSLYLVGEILRRRDPEYRG